MSVEERDPHTGHMTTGHEWNGIKELNTPVPKPVWFFLISAFLFGVGYWILMPAWPYGVNYTRGLLGYDQRAVVTEKVAAAAAARAEWGERIVAGSFEEIQADPQLMDLVRENGPALFGDNCAVCHGTNATGGPGYPNLAEAPWLWGGDEANLLETLRVGINASHPETRYSEMLAFGRDKMLERDEVTQLAAYVQSLSQPEMVLDAEARASAEQLFADNCAGCHGADAKGSTDLGAPDLTDAFSIYGNDLATIRTTIHGGRQGQMPAWEGKLSELQRKLLALYVLDLRAQRQ